MPKNPNRPTEVFPVEPVTDAGRPLGVTDSFLSSLAGEPPPDWDWNRLPVAVDRYEILGVIASGGMGTLCLARDKFLGRQVAVKVLRGEEVHDPKTIARFRQEARIHSQLHHPGIPPLHDVGRMADGRPYIAMKYVAGSTLAFHLGGRPVARADLGNALARFERVCRIVAYAHAKGVVHRDLNPNNILVSDRGRVWVIDWGLAKMVSPTPADHEDGTTTVTLPDHSMTGEGVALGTPAYMPPEQAAGRVGATAPTSDVFGLGATLCEMLTGEPPYTGPAEGSRDRGRTGQLTAAIGRLDRAAAPPAVIALAKSCLSPSATDRPPTAAAVVRVLVGLRGDAPG